jgi:LysR family glycine cleavage system transcriptional activator
MGKVWSRLPSLTSLRVFEAAARNSSFTRAATELHVTQAAVSRQVRQLEQQLDKTLFVRLHRRVELTQAGRALADELARTFASIARCVDEIRGRRRQSLRLSVEPGFAARWLMPRLSRFWSAHSDIDLEVESSAELREIGRDTDLAIRHIDGASRGLGSGAILLASVACYPVIAPALLGKSGAVCRAPDLARFQFLHEDDGRAWQRWLDAAGAGDLAASRRVRLSDVALVMQAAIDGHGVALGDDLLAGDDIRGGRLVKLFPTEIRSGAYWLVGVPSGRRSAAERTFADWLRAELTAAS